MHLPIHFNMPHLALRNLHPAALLILLALAFHHRLELRQVLFCRPRSRARPTRSKRISAAHRRGLPNDAHVRRKSAPKLAREEALSGVPRLGAADHLVPRERVVNRAGRSLEVEPVIDNHHFDLAVDSRASPDEVLNRLRELGLAEEVEALDDCVRLQTDRYRCVEGVLRHLILVDELAPRNRLGNGDHEVLGVLEKGRELLEETVPVLPHEQRPLPVVRLGDKVTPVLLLVVLVIRFGVFAFGEIVVLLSRRLGLFSRRQSHFQLHSQPPAALPALFAVLRRALPRRSCFVRRHRSLIATSRLPRERASARSFGAETNTLLG
mmetsp:Transcript_64600/g.154148  ORF Transcript_64600/g.154148 Transcript_64600/m.154148 type:complete len:323 (+) Transcript_64600:1407-2375(+)